MPYDPNIHHRRSIRLKGYDYSQVGAYFVTVGVLGRECLLGNVVDGVIELSPDGKIAQLGWLDLPGHFGTVRLDEFVVMPNHIHGVVVIGDDSRTGASLAGRGSGTADHTTAGNRTGGAGTGEGISPPRKPTLGQIVAYYKYQTTRLINQTRCTPGLHVWQRNYYEHIIRNDESLGRIRDYIAKNPLRWELDEYHPGSPTKPSTR